MNTDNHGKDKRRMIIKKSFIDRIIFMTESFQKEFNYK